MMPRITLRLDRQRPLGFGRQNAGWSTPVGALASDVCPAWQSAAGTSSKPVGIAIQRDRTGNQQFSTTKYAPSLPSQSRIGAGAEGDERSS